VNDQLGFDFRKKSFNALPIADVERFVPILRNGLLKVLQDPTGVAFRSKEHGAVIAVYSDNAKSPAMKSGAGRRPDEPAGTGDNYAGSGHEKPQFFTEIPAGQVARAMIAQIGILPVHGYWLA
jgi:hypothetical protein